MAESPHWSGTPYTAWDVASEWPWNLGESSRLGGGFVLGNPIKGQPDLDKDLGDGGVGVAWQDPLTGSVEGWK